MISNDYTLTGEVYFMIEDANTKKLVGFLRTNASQVNISGSYDSCGVTYDINLEVEGNDRFFKCVIGQPVWSIVSDRVEEVPNGLSPFHFPEIEKTIFLDYKQALRAFLDKE